MLKKAAVFMALLMAVCTVKPLNVKADSHNYLTHTYSTPVDETLFTDAVHYSDNWIDVKDKSSIDIIKGANNSKLVDGWDSPIRYVRQAPELVIMMDGDLPIGSKFELELTNLVWFFRGTEKLGSKKTIATLDYSGGIEKLLPYSYDENKGIYEPCEISSEGGVYERLENQDGEIPYKLEIDEDDPRKATVTLTHGAEREDNIYIPLVTRLTYYADAKIEIKSKHSAVTNGLYLILRADNGPDSAFDSPIVKASTFTSVTNPVKGNTEFPLSEIVITENMYGSMDNGSFMLSAPEGYAILPDVETSLLVNQYLTRDIMNLKDGNGDYIVNVELTGGLNWELNYDNHDQFGKREKDFSMRYRNPGGVIDSSKLIFKIDRLEKSTRGKQGTMIITGLKLVDMEGVGLPDAEISISRFLKLDNLTEESFLAGGKDTGPDRSEKALNAFNIDVMPLEELIKTEEFKAKTYVTPFGGGLQPKAAITRGQLCEMFYNLFADKEKTYQHSFVDISGSPYENAIAFCAQNSIIVGYGDGTFLPDGFIKRGEFAITLNNILKLDAYLVKDYGYLNHWSYEAMGQLAQANILAGGNGDDFEPENPLTKEEAVTMINRSFERGSIFINDGVTYNDVLVTDWSYGYMMNAAFGWYDINPAADMK